jgi:AcrR family transcriptional regulator
MANTINPKKHEDQRQRLLAHARKLFAAHGVKETSMSQIARACQVTKAALYHYFKSKDEILREIFLSRVDEKEAVVALLKRARNLEECLLTMGRHMVEDVTKPDHRELMKIMLSETMKSAEMRKFYVKFISGQLSYFTQEILMPMVKIRKPEKEVRLLFFQFFASMMHYSWYRIMIGDISPLIGDPETFVKTLAQTYAERLQKS